MNSRWFGHHWGPSWTAWRDGPPAAVRIGLGGALVLAVLVVYLPAAGGEFLWDDDSYIRDLVPLRTVSGLLDIWTDPLATPQYYPLVFSSFWVEYHVWGLEPSGYHVVNILLHAGIALLPRAGDAVVLANKVRNVRAILGTSPAAVASALARFAANVLIVDHASSTFHEARSLVGAFVRGRGSAGAGGASSALLAALTELEDR